MLKTERYTPISIPGILNLFSNHLNPKVAAVIIIRYINANVKNTSMGPNHIEMYVLAAENISDIPTTNANDEYLIIYIISFDIPSKALLSA